MMEGDRGKAAAEDEGTEGEEDEKGKDSIDNSPDIGGSLKSAKLAEEFKEEDSASDGEDSVRGGCRRNMDCVFLCFQGCLELGR